MGGVRLSHRPPAEREAGLVSRRKDGLHAFYRLDDLRIEKFCQLVCEFLLEAFGGEEDPC